MVSKAIDDGLLFRIQKYVANDINSRVPPVTDVDFQPEDVFIISFSRIMNNWQAICQVQDPIVGYYVLSHDGGTGKTMATIFHRLTTNEAIV